MSFNLKWRHKTRKSNNSMRDEALRVTSCVKSSKQCAFVSKNMILEFIAKERVQNAISFWSTSSIQRNTKRSTKKKKKTATDLFVPTSSGSLPQQGHHVGREYKAAQQKYPRRYGPVGESSVLVALRSKVTWALVIGGEGVYYFPQRESPSLVHRRRRDRKRCRI